MKTPTFEKLADELGIEFTIEEMTPESCRMNGVYQHLDPLAAGGPKYMGWPTHAAFSVDGDLLASGYSREHAAEMLIRSEFRSMTEEIESLRAAGSEIRGALRTLKALV